jgi:hypothetical protein
MILKDKIAVAYHFAVDRQKTIHEQLCTPPLSFIAMLKPLE